MVHIVKGNEKSINLYMVAYQWQKLLGNAIQIYAFKRLHNFHDLLEHTQNEKLHMINQNV